MKALSAIAIVSSSLLLPPQGGHVTSPATGTWINVRQFPVPTPHPGGIIDIIRGPDDALWFTDWASDSIWRMTTTGVTTEYPLPTACDGCRPAGIAVGPDGALWFTEVFGNKIGRLTTSGTITEYSLPDESYPESIVKGPDGALWFVEGGRDNIGRITTTGAITEYPLPTDCGVPYTCYPSGITAGPDGALWFAERNGSRIGRITTDGKITEYLLPVSNYACCPRTVTVGPDGALWFTLAGESVGRITTSGAVTLYQIPGAAALTSDPQEITAGPDGALWFTDGGLQGKALWRLTTAGVFTGYSPAPGIGLGGIAVGPDGALWAGGLYSSTILTFPACGLGLTAAFADTTLHIGFTLGTTATATWNIGYFSQTGLTGLRSTVIPPIVPPRSFTIPWGPGFPSQGDIAVASSLAHPITNEFQCAEWRIVNTSSAPRSNQLQ